ncbi:MULTISPECIES: nuclear transport factor 2 family protein [unclassified Nocardia]|uniref:nuclear transport factor 2 family protein n=1 Tax=unclassified Nocardia TaxID=2637762 RepID=UPI001CE41BCF|nr:MULTISPECIES: nuclear transport factor 2 family protein [unclassified Nocardia]
MTTISPVTADQLAAWWTDLWNGSFDLATRLCADDFRIFFAAAAPEDGPHRGDKVTGPAQFVEYLHEYHATKPGVRFVVDGPAAGALDETGAGSFAVRWYAELPDRRKLSGIDMFDVVDGKLTTVWSVTGQRLFPTVEAD